MNWYRMKTVLIFLFLAINIFLLTLLGVENFSKTKTARERAEVAKEALMYSGITVSAPVPHKTPALRTLTLKNPKADPAGLAARFLGGKAVRMGDTWRKDGKTVTFSEEGFVYESGLAPVKPEKKSIKEMQAALENMGISMQYAEGTLENDAVRFVQKVDDAVLFDGALLIYPASDGSVARAKGDWVEIVDTAGHASPIKSAADALLMYLREGHSGSTVCGITPGYKVFRAAEDYQTADAVPVWRIETEDSVHFYDAR